MSVGDVEIFLFRKRGEPRGAMEYGGGVALVEWQPHVAYPRLGELGDVCAARGDDGYSVTAFGGGNGYGQHVRFRTAYAHSRGAYKYLHVSFLPRIFAVIRRLFHFTIFVRKSQYCI